MCHSGLFLKLDSETELALNWNDLSATVWLGTGDSAIPNDFDLGKREFSIPPVTGM